MIDAQLRRNCGMKQNDAGAWLCACGAILDGDAFDCPTCKRQRLLDQHREALELAHAQWRSRLEAFVALPGTPAFPFARLNNAEFIDKVKGRKLLAAAKRYTLDRSLVFSGPTGCGKSTLALAMLRRIATEALELALQAKVGSPPTPLLKTLRGLVWTDGFAIAKARKQTALGIGEAPLIARALQAPVLVLDEVGFEPLSEVIFEIVDERYREGLITIMTTGQKPAAFAARYGDACWRRFAELGAVISEWPEDKPGAG